MEMLTPLPMPQSAWHFGESDLLHLPDCSAAMVLSRGLLLIAAPMLAWPALSSASLSGLSGGFILSVSPALGLLLALSIAALHLWLLRRAPAADRHEALALSVLLLGGGPIVGLGLYFCLWHTLDHFHQLSRALSCQPRRLVRAAVPRTLGALVLLLLGAWLVPSGQWSDLIVQLTAALTIPHALVVHFGWSPRESGLPLAAATD